MENKIESSSPLREPKTALEEQAQALVGAVKFYRRMCRDHGLTSKEATKSAGWMEHVANATDSQIAEARSAPKPSSAEGSPSSLPAPSPGETALDLEAIAPELVEMARREPHEDDDCPEDDTCRCENITKLNAEFKALAAAIAGRPGAQESRPLTWTREKPTAPGLYRVRKHKFVSSAEVWTHPSFGRSFDMNCEDLSPHDPEIEWCGPYPEPQTLSEGGATA